MQINDLNSLVNSILDKGLSVKVNASGISMFPLLIPHCTLHIAPAKEVSRGDIIVFRRNDGKYIAHRVINIGDSIICRGDSCASFDQPVTADNLIGIATHFTINGKTFSLTNKIAKLYGRLTIALYPVSARINNIMARIALKLKLIRL